MSQLADALYDEYSEQYYDEDYNVPEVMIDYIDSLGLTPAEMDSLMDQIHEEW